VISFFVAIIIAGISILVLVGYVSQNSPELDKTPFREAWKKVTEKAQHEMTWELAVVNADKLLDAALKKKGYKGSTMGERLISAKKVLSNRNSVWEAHKLRNRIVHEDNVRLNEVRVYEALKGFEIALKDVGAL
jgi:hypothetical protein